MRLLIVDDDPALRTWLRTVFARYARCSVAFDGAEATTAVRLALEDGDPYDLITLDIMMPGIDGHEALSRIRQLEKEHEIHGSDGAKVIMTTALEDARHCVRPDGSASGQALEWSHGTPGSPAFSLVKPSNAP